MKRTRTICVISMLAMFVATSVGLAEKASHGFGDKPAFHKRGPGGHGEMLKDMVKRRIRFMPHALKMDDAQKKVYYKMAKVHYDALVKLIDEMNAKTDAFTKSVDAILKPEQKERFERLKQHRGQRKGMGRRGKKGGPHGRGPGSKKAGRRPGMMKRALETVELSPEKKELVRTILNEMHEKMKASDREDRQARRELFKEMNQKIAGVLSPDEHTRLKEAVKELRREWRGKRQGKFGSDHDRGSKRGKRSKRPHHDPNEPEWLR